MIAANPYLIQISYMKMIFILAFTGFIPIHANPQTISAPVDSLKQAIHNYPRKDSTRLNMLLQLSKGVDVYKEGTVVLDEAIQLAKSLDMESKLGDAWLFKASDLIDLGNDSLALSIVLDSALPIFKKLKIGKREAVIYTFVARIFQNRGEYYKSIEYNQIALLKLEKINENKMLPQVCNDIGAVYSILSDYVQSNEYYMKAKNYYEKIGESGFASMAVSNIASNERSLKKYRSAINYYRQALTIQYAVKDSERIARTLQGIGITYDQQFMVDSSLWYYYKALAINKRNNYKLSIAENLSQIGTTYKDQKRYQDAYLSLNESLLLFKELNRKSNMHSVQVNIGELLCNAPDTFFNKNTIPVSERYKKAKSLFNGIIGYAQESKDQDLESKGWKGLSLVYEKSGDFKKAFDAYKRSADLQDTIFNAEKIATTTKQIDELEYKTKEAALQAAHQAEVKQQKTVKNAIASGAGILAFGSLISFLFYKRKRDAVAKKNEAEFKTRVTDTEMKALRAQMNPHFIFNSLNSISDYIAKNDTRSADRYLSKFAKLMRLILENSEQKEVPLSDDLKTLELYMQLEALRMNNKFSYEIIVDDDLDKDATMVPPLILQPFVENSIWHGIAKKEGLGKILIHIKKEGDNMINCIVEDDGVGRQHSASLKATTLAPEKSSLGMKITQARIDILNKMKNTRAVVELSDLAQGLRVEVKLPLATNF